jgi:hypothetical protein
MTLKIFFIFNCTADLKQSLYIDYKQIAFVLKSSVILPKSFENHCPASATAANYRLKQQPKDQPPILKQKACNRNQDIVSYRK